jgi:hypothetical protein
MQTWETFSIIDHRRPVYRQALALVDRIVVPIASLTYSLLLNYAFKGEI